MPGRLRALQAAAARRAAALADRRYKTSEDSDLLTIERLAVSLRCTWAAKPVGLIRALSNGWQMP